MLFCVGEIEFDSFYNYLFDFGTAPTVWYFLVFFFMIRMP
jgi:hypothetical protein